MTNLLSFLKDHPIEDELKPLVVNLVHLEGTKIRILVKNPNDISLHLICFCNPLRGGIFAIRELSVKFEGDCNPNYFIHEQLRDEGRMIKDMKTKDNYFKTVEKNSELTVDLDIGKIFRITSGTVKYNVKWYGGFLVFTKSLKGEERKFKKINVEFDANGLDFEAKKE